MCKAIAEDRGGRVRRDQLGHRGWDMLLITFSPSLAPKEENGTVSSMPLFAASESWIPQLGNKGDTLYLGIL